MAVAQILFTLKPGADRLYGHVTSVRVNRDFRGMGLGPLLFKEVSAQKRDCSKAGEVLGVQVPPGGFLLRHR